MELIVVLYHLIHVFWGDALPAVDVGLLTSQIQDGRCNVLEHTCQEYWCRRAQAAGILALSQVVVYPTNRKLKLCSGGAGDVASAGDFVSVGGVAFAGDVSSRSSSSHGARLKTLAELYGSSGLGLSQ